MIWHLGKGLLDSNHNRMVKTGNSTMTCARSNYSCAVPSRFQFLLPSTLQDLNCLASRNLGRSAIAVFVMQGEKVHTMSPHSMLLITNVGNESVCASRSAMKILSESVDVSSNWQFEICKAVSFAQQ